MTGFILSSMRNPSPWGLYRVRDSIDLSPTYQREGGIWTLENRQLLIDTIINRFDVPKIYVHKLNKPIDKNGDSIEYAVIDGRQRLETIFSFIDGDFALADDFEYFHDDNVKASGYTYSDLAREYPDLKSDFDSSALDVVMIQTDDLELIEEMFSRLNEAVPLNAAEKRNALPGPLPGAVRALTGEPFWSSKMPFPNRRYRHYDLAAKMLYIESRRGIPDTKKAYLDRFFLDHKKDRGEDVKRYLDASISVISKMESVFIEKDPLLRSVGMIVLYYHLFKKSKEIEKIDIITRPKLLQFETRRLENRKLAEEDISEANYNLLEFDRLAQSLNDAIAMRFRLSVMDEVIFGGELGFPSPEASTVAS